MNELNQNTSEPSKKEHGTMLSYVIGFVLSLIFTINAYYAVVNKSISGNRLLVTILVFAVLQMFVQVFFFLHLGRGPKPGYNVIFFIGTAGLILVLVIGSIFIMNNLHYNMTPSDVITKLSQDEGIGQVSGVQTGACKQIGTTYKITIKDNHVTPTPIKAHRCDELAFINEDDQLHTINFGVPSKPLSYSGELGLQTRKSYPGTITLNQNGNFNFYDQLNTSITGSFLVSP